MRKLFSWQLMLFASVFLMCACEYQLNEVYDNPIKTDVKPPELSVFSLNLDMQIDTLYVYESKEIKFSFNTDDRRIQAVELLIDNVQQEIIMASEGQLDGVNYYTLAEGFHSLQLNIYTNTGTGSIAEQLNQESFLLSHKWVMYVDRNYSKLTKETSHNGVFSMEWPECKSHDFIEYVVYKYIGYEDVVELSRQTSTSFEDDKYVGESCSYMVVAVLSGGELHWGGLQMQTQIPDFVLETHTDNRSFLKYTRPKYYSGIDTITILKEHGWPLHKWLPVANFTNFNDTVVEIADGNFGDDVKYRLKVVPKVKYPSYETDSYGYMKELSGKLGYCIDPDSYWLEDVHQVAADEFAFVGYESTLKRYSTSKLAIVESISTPVMDGCGSSRIGSVQYSTTGKTLTADIGCWMDIALTKTNNFSVDNVRNLTHLTGETYAPSIPISDVGIGVIETHLSTDFYLYDFNTSKIIGRANYHVYSIKINSTANYLYIDGGTNLIVHFKDGVFTTKVEIDHFDRKFKHFEFHGSKPDQAVVWYDDELLFKDCETYSTLNSYSLNGEELYDVDYYNGRVLTWKNNELRVRNLDDGIVTHTIPVSFSPNYRRTDCNIIGNCIVYKDGVIYFLK